MPRLGLSWSGAFPSNVLVGVALMVSACGPSTPQAGKGTLPVGASVATGLDGGPDVLRTGGTGGPTREQNGPVITGSGGLAGCEPVGAIGGTGAAYRDAGSGTDITAVIEAGAMDRAAMEGGTGSATGRLPGNDAAIPKMVREGGVGDAETNADAGDAGAPGDGGLAIVELLINPAGTDTGREWIEIINRSAHPVSLDNWHIADLVNDVVVDFSGSGTTSQGIDAVAAPRPELETGARAVLFQSADPAKNGGVVWPGDAVAGTFGTRVSLNNDGDTIAVCVGPCATGLVLAHLTWDSSLGAQYDGHALVIDDAGHRCAATAAFGDAGSFGTPFTANPTCP